jgi:Dockerin type I domain
MKVFKLLLSVSAVLLSPILLIAQGSAVVSGTIDMGPNPNYSIEVYDDNDILISTNPFTTPEYAITLPIGSDYTIVPVSNVDPLNDVNSFDVELIRRHINLEQLFSNPCQYIAADANNDGVVSVADFNEVKSLILGVFPSFPNTNSWRFFRSDFLFSDPNSPFGVSQASSIAIQNLSGPLDNLDFYGIKIGNIDNTICNGQEALNINGKVIYDIDNTCSLTNSDIDLSGWKVIASGPLGDFVALANYEGNYKIFVPAGTYTVTAVAPNTAWGFCTESVGGIQVDIETAPQLTFYAQAEVECPVLEVLLEGFQAIHCYSDNRCYVDYSNQGTIPAVDAYVDVTLDSFLTIVSAEKPYTALGNNVFRFQLGNIPINSTGSFLITYAIGCDVELGQTHCSMVTIYPDDMCLPQATGWDGANLVITATCDDNLVEFTVTNIGADMQEAVEYVVIEDIMLMPAAQASN